MTTGRRGADRMRAVLRGACGCSAMDPRTAWAAVSAAVVGAAGALAGSAGPFGAGGVDAVDLQLARTAEELQRLLRGRQGELMRHLAADAAFLALLVLAVALLTAACLAPRGEHGWRLRPWAWAIAVVPIGADATEDVLLWLAARNDWFGLAPAIHTVATLKWIAFAVLAAALAALVADRLWFGVRLPDPDDPPGPSPWEEADEAPAGEEAPAGDEPPTGEEAGASSRDRTVGIALSGGGIRSAAFGLGALSALGNERVRSARYLSAASGGAYIAAGMTLQAHRDHLKGKPETQLPFHPGSPELERLRARSSFLALNGADGRIGLFQALSRIAFNVLVLWLVVFAVGRPVGWLLSSEGLHPELRAREPLLQTAALDPKLAAGELAVASAGSTRCGDGRGTRFLVSVRDAAIRTQVAATRTTRHPRDETIPVVFAPGEVRVCDAEATVAAQPRASVGGEWADLVEVTHQPVLAVEGGGVPTGDDIADHLAERLRVEDQPVLLQQTGFRGRDAISIDWWMFVVPLGALVTAMVWSAVWQRRPTLELAAMPKFLAFVAWTGIVLLVVLPWLLQELPTAGDRIYDLLPGAPITVPGAPRGFLAWVTALVAAGQAVRSFLKRPKREQSRVGRSSLLLAKIAAFGLVAVAGVGAVVAVVQQGALNGPGGRLAGMGAYWWGPGVRDVPDAGRWLLVVGLLAVLAITRSAHHWSFLPLYRDRIAAAFSLTDVRLSDNEVRSRETQASLTDCLPHDVPERYRPRWPELVICAAVNLNDPGLDHTVPAGRWADSFTFSPSEIGGPLVGYVPTVRYEQTLSPARRRDITLPSIVGVSGAAFSPAMGKFSYGPIGGVFALLNLRLGLWLPHPAWVRTMDGVATWRRRPGWPYLLRELFGRFRRQRPFLYVTDGGHWENLGLVELVRRRCDEIYVVSAAGDGDRSFATIAEAIALAREQCRVDIQVDLSPLRAPVADPPDTPPARQLLRRGKDGALKPQPVAPATHAVGWFERPGGGRGRILFVEANLTADMPWDVQAHAEASTVFPDDPTTDQFFDHRQLESYRRLGWHQLETALASPGWAAAEAYVRGTVTSTQLQAFLAAG